MSPLEHFHVRVAEVSSGPMDGTEYEVTKVKSLPMDSCRLAEYQLIDQLLFYGSKNTCSPGHKQMNF